MSSVLLIIIRRCHSVNSHSSHDHRFMQLTLFSLFTHEYLCVATYPIASYVFNCSNSIGNESSSDNSEIDYYVSHSYPNMDIIPKGSMYYTLKIKIVDEDRMEDDEVFRITAIPEDLPDGHIYCTTYVYIKDDDGKLIYAKYTSVLLQYSCYMYVHPSS